MIEKFILKKGILGTEPTIVRKNTNYITNQFECSRLKAKKKLKLNISDNDLKMWYHHFRSKRSKSNISIFEFFGSIFFEHEYKIR